jgi:ribosomal protein L17
MLTNLVKNGRVVTTPKRAKVLKAEADAFFSKLLNYSTRYDESSAKRECIRYVKAVIFGKEEGKKVIEKMLPKYQESKQKSFVKDYKLGFRKGD